MSMSTHVLGFRPPDEKWKKMKQAWDACESAGVPQPREVEVFFGSVAPDPRGVEVRLLEGERGCLRVWRDEGAEGYEVDLTKVPKDVTILRFYNSW